MSNLVTIYGGSGFVGRYITRRMALLGWRVRVAVRRPNEALHVRPYGAVGQVEPIFCNIRDDASVAAAMRGAQAVVNCVGTFDSKGRNNFGAIHNDGAARVARLAAQSGIARLVHLSALGADAGGDSDYARTKAAGEVAVAAAFPAAVILRPSAIAGPEDGFFNRFAKMATMGPVLPIVGGGTLFQPVYVDDVAAAAEHAILSEAKGIFELGGPQVKPLGDWISIMLGVIGRRRLVANLPFAAGAAIGLALDAGSALTIGLVPNRVLTRDQVRLLRHDNVVSEGAQGFADLGIEPTSVQAVMKDYLWRYRPGGQFADIQSSARNLKT